MTWMSAAQPSCGNTSDALRREFRLELFAAASPFQPVEQVRRNDQHFQLGVVQLRYDVSHVRREIPAEHNHFFPAARMRGSQLPRLLQRRQAGEPLSSFPSVLLVRWQVYAKLNKWDGALDIGTALTKLVPDQPQGWISRSYALHALRRTAEAQKQLLAVIARFPAGATMRYNLACYACPLGDLPAAREWLVHAFALDSTAAFKLAALADPDLDPLWTEEQQDND